eukprot:CAMPEP_0182463476 /NCGR_PEP_ID=MMETSP1319-20130603/7382_1 /TAXON_ID=172717 /ORGANISM="Bolidomonas pacifica, Strain RCC208" /LENGTH=331 /DNA_ID=CAMNT_0024663019 /DNA_START=48 /DNA_END=1039 /DNA_ORIENTATION=+
MASEPLKQESPKPQRQSIRQRFSQRRSSIATEAILMFSNFRHNLKDFIWHSGKYSVVAAVVPVLGVLMCRSYGKEVTDVFFGSMSTEVPPILNNVTVVPLSPALTKKYYCETRSTSTWLILLQVTFWSCGVFPSLLRALIMFRPNRTDTILCSLMTIVATALSFTLMIIEYSYVGEHGEYSSPQDGFFGSNPLTSIIPMILFGLPPVTFTVAYFYSEKRDKEKHAGIVGYVKVYAIVYACNLLEFVIAFAFTLQILPYFFLSETSTFQRFLIRMFSQGIFLNIGIEVSWRWALYAAENMNCDVQDATVATFAFYACLVPLMARVMQGSAET